MIIGILVVFSFRIQLGGLLLHVLVSLIILSPHISWWLIENALIKFLLLHFEGTKDLLFSRNLV